MAHERILKFKNAFAVLFTHDSGIMVMTLMEYLEIENATLFYVLFTMGALLVAAVQFVSFVI